MTPEAWPPAPTADVPELQKRPVAHPFFGAGLTAAILAYVASRLSMAYMFYWTQNKIMKGSGIAPTAPLYPFMHSRLETVVLLGLLSALSFVLSLWVVWTNGALTKGAFKRISGEPLMKHRARRFAATDVVFGCFGFAFGLCALMQVIFCL